MNYLPICIEVTAQEALSSYRHLINSGVYNISVKGVERLYEKIKYAQVGGKIELSLKLNNNGSKSLMIRPIPTDHPITLLRKRYKREEATNVLPQD